MSKLREMQSAARGEHIAVVAWRSARKRISISLEGPRGLRCDLASDVRMLDVKIPLTVRPLTPADRDALKPEETDSPEDFYERLLRLQVLDSGLQTCYSAVADDGRVCYVQWLIEARQNDLVHDLFEGSFPRLQPDEVLLEAAYTFPVFRGHGVMAAAMGRITELGRERGFEHARTFGGEHNVPSLKGYRVPSLKGYRQAGYHEDVRRVEQWRLFRHSFSFTPLSAVAGHGSVGV